MLWLESTFFKLLKLLEHCSDSAFRPVMLRQSLILVSFNVAWIAALFFFLLPFSLSHVIPLNYLRTDAPGMKYLESIGDLLTMVVNLTLL